MISLMKRSKTRDKFDSKSTLILTNNLEYTLSNDLEFVEDTIMKEIFKTKFKEAIQMLNYDERNLINYVYVNGNQLKQYASFANLSYSRVFKMKKRIVKKLEEFLLKEEALI
ncbi:hypothetical protein D3C81_1961450 [compost metagenome]